MMNPISIMIVEDNRAFRDYLKNVISTNDDYKLSGSFSSGEDFCAHLKTEPEQSVDLILLDLNLKGKHGLSFVPLIRTLLSDARIIVVTSDSSYLTALEAIKLGVSGYILKDSSVSDIRKSIQEVYDGGCIIDPKLASMVLDALTASKAQIKSPLSNRELEVLTLLASGFIKKEIADTLGISYAAVNLYSKNLYAKMKVNNVAEAVAKGIRQGLI